jgi:chromosome segregation ATPase
MLKVKQVGNQFYASDSGTVDVNKYLELQEQFRMLETDYARLKSKYDTLEEQFKEYKSSMGRQDAQDKYDIVIRKLNAIGNNLKFYTKKQGLEELKEKENHLEQELKEIRYGIINREQDYDDYDKGYNW